QPEESPDVRSCDRTEACYESIQTQAQTRSPAQTPRAETTTRGPHLSDHRRSPGHVSNTDAFGSSPLFIGIVDQRNPTSAGIARPHRSNRRIPTVLGSEERRWPVGLLIATSPT